VEERLFLDGITLYAAYISPWHVKCPTLVETYFTDTRLAVRNRTTVATRITANAIAVQFLVQITFANLPVENFPQRGHRTPENYFSPVKRRIVGSL